MIAESLFVFAWSTIAMVLMTVVLAAGVPAVLDWRARARRQLFAVRLPSTDLEWRIGEQLHADLDPAPLAGR